MSELPAFAFAAHLAAPIYPSSTMLPAPDLLTQSLQASAQGKDAQTLRGAQNGNPT